MDAHTISAAHGTSTAANTPEQEAIRNCDQLGHIRALIEAMGQLKKSPPGLAIELGQHLLALKNTMPRCDFLPLFDSLGLGKDRALYIKAAQRFGDTDDYCKIIEAVPCRNMLFQMMRLDDAELSQLNDGATVRHISLASLPTMGVRALRAALRTKAPAKSGVDARFDKPASPMPPTTGPLLETPTDYPAVYALLPGDFNGQPVSLVRHQGKTWLIAEEVATLVGDTPEALAAVEDYIARSFDTESLADACTRIRLASTNLVVRLLDTRAIELLAIVRPSETATRLASWMSETGQPAKLTVVPEKLGPTLNQCLEKLGNQHYLVHRLLAKLNAQVCGIHSLAVEAARQ